MRLLSFQLPPLRAFHISAAINIHPSKFLCRPLRSQQTSLRCTLTDVTGAKDFEGLLVKDLKQLLEEQGLSQSGKKSVLIERLIQNQLANVKYLRNK